MKKRVALSELYKVMQEALDNGCEVNFNPRGTSMLPMLHMDGDRVIIKKADGFLKKYDLPLYRRDNGAFVLHRIVKVHPGGIYDMCGDNQTIIEKNVRHEQIIGVVTGFYRKNKFISCSALSYKLYSRLWGAVRPLGHYAVAAITRLRLVKKNLIHLIIL